RPRRPPAPGRGHPPPRQPATHQPATRQQTGQPVPPGHQAAPGRITIPAGGPPRVPEGGLRPPGRRAPPVSPPDPPPATARRGREAAGPATPASPASPANPASPARFTR